MTINLSAILQSARAIDASRSYRLEVGAWLSHFDQAARSPSYCLYALPGFNGKECEIIKADTSDECLRELRSRYDNECLEKGEIPKWYKVHLPDHETN